MANDKDVEYKREGDKEIECLDPNDWQEERRFGGRRKWWHVPVARLWVKITPVGIFRRSRPCFSSLLPLFSPPSSLDFLLRYCTLVDRQNQKFPWFPIYLPLLDSSLQNSSIRNGNNGSIPLRARKFLREFLSKEQVVL